MRPPAARLTHRRLRCPCWPLAVYDDDGNNEMDADELVVAWKKVTDQKISTVEAQSLIGQGATNGNSTLDKDEFVQLVRAQA
jgi:Ca2+-binding EF-hand superfamily protein